MARSGNGPPRFTDLRPASARASAAARAGSKKRNTRCEKLLRKQVTLLGLRYRIDVADLPGRPDIVFRRARVVVFCDGDFWHGRDLSARLSRLEKGHNAQYWIAKIQTNVARDLRHTQALEALGWKVLRFWERDIYSSAPSIADKIAAVVTARLAER